MNIKCFSSWNNHIWCLMNFFISPTVRNVKQLLLFSSCICIMILKRSSTANPDQGVTVHFAKPAFIASRLSRSIALILSKTKIWISGREDNVLEAWHWIWHLLDKQHWCGLTCQAPQFAFPPPLQSNPTCVVWHGMWVQTPKLVSNHNQPVALGAHAGQNHLLSILVIFNTSW